MYLILLLILLLINIVGFINRKKAWSKIFLLSQFMVFFSIGVSYVMYDSYNNQTLQTNKDIKTIIKTKEDTLYNTKRLPDTFKVIK